MTTVHDASYEVLRSLGMTTFFGNPGSNELNFLDAFPEDFRYVLALQEGAGLAMADSYSQATEMRPLGAIARIDRGWARLRGPDLGATSDTCTRLRLQGTRRPCSSRCRRH